MQQDERRALAPAVVGPYFAAVNGDHHLGHNLGLSHIARAVSAPIGVSERSRLSPTKAEGIIHYVRMRHDSARHQLEQLRKETPRANDSESFPATVEPVPSAALL
jgi:hypothetical protein